MTHLYRLFSLVFGMFVALNAQAADLMIKDLVLGKGAEASVENQVSVHYTGWLMDGTKFDSSLDRNRPFQFTLGAREVIPGWDQGVQGMRVGGKRELIIPPEMAYGSRGVGRVIPPNSTLKFEVELLGVSAPAFQNINNEELKELQKQGVKLVDVRTPAEWKKTGVIKGSLLLPFRMSNGKINPKFPEDLKRIAGPKEKVMLICRTGNRTKMASQMMSSRYGYEGIHNVRHGITYWLREKNPTVAPVMSEMNKTCSLC